MGLCGVLGPASVFASSREEITGLRLWVQGFLCCRMVSEALEPAAASAAVVVDIGWVMVSVGSRLKQSGLCDSVTAVVFIPFLWSHMRVLP